MGAVLWNEIKLGSSVWQVIKLASPVCALKVLDYANNQIYVEYCDANTILRSSHRTINDRLFKRAFATQDSKTF